MVVVVVMLEVGGSEPRLAAWVRVWERWTSGWLLGWWRLSRRMVCRRWNAWAVDVRSMWYAAVRGGQREGKVEARNFCCSLKEG